MPTASLLFETLRLRQRQDSDELARAWSATPADGLYPLADYERAAQYIMRRLEATECADAAPSAFVGPLRRHVASGESRNLLCDEEAARAIGILIDEGIPCILLKGLARRAAGERFPCGDARTTTDVDLLLPPDEVERAWETLVEAGYQQAKQVDAPHHAPSLVGKGRISIELYRSMAPGLPPDEAWHRANDDARELDWKGLHVAIPSPTELVWHAVTHALQYGSKSWKLRFFLDAASVMAGDEPIGWDVIGRRLDAGEIGPERWPRRWLDAAAQLAGVSMPPGLLAGQRPFDLTHALRWRLNVLRERGTGGFGGRLLEEGTRRELGYGVAPKAPGSNLYRRTRRRLGGLAARVVYGVWRATGARAMRI